MPNKSHIRKEGPDKAHGLRGWSIMAVKTWQHEHVGAGNMASAARK